MIEYQDTTQTRHRSNLFTGESLLAMGEIEPYELEDGQIRHYLPHTIVEARVLSQFASALYDYVTVHKQGVVAVGGVGIFTQRNPDTVRAADILFISHERLAQAKPDSFLDVPPELVVEIMSPSDRWSDVRRKLREYFAAGVTVVLIVEPDEQTLSVYRAPTELQELTGTAVLTLDDILPGFRCPVAELFGK